MEYFSGQIPINCQLCEAGNKIKWKCVDCDLLVCDRCKDNVHPKFKNATYHNVINIKEAGLNVNQSNISDKCDAHPGQNCCLICRTCDRSVCPICIAQIHNGHELVEINKSSELQNIKSLVNVDLRIINEFATSLTATENICTLQDNSLWINSGRFQELEKVRIDGNDLTVIDHFNIFVTAMAVTSTNNVLYVTKESTKLVQIDSKNGTMTDSCYCAAPLQPTSVHVSRDDKVLVGARGGDKPFPGTGRRVLIVMDTSGNHIAVYEHDNNNRPLFTYIYSICTTKHGCVGVVDSLSGDDRGRILFLGQSGNILNIYNGDPCFTTSYNPFRPRKIVATPSDNIISNVPSTHTLHIFDNSGNVISNYKTNIIGILYPTSLGFTYHGQLYIGCDKRHDKKLYLINISGC